MIKDTLLDALHDLAPWVLVALWLGIGYAAVQAVAAGGIWVALGVILALVFAVPVALMVLFFAKMRSLH